VSHRLGSSVAAMTSTTRESALERVRLVVVVVSECEVLAVDVIKPQRHDVAAGQEDRMPQHRIELIPIGRVESTLTDREAAPHQGREGSPDAWLVIEPDVLEGLQGIRPGDEVIVLTWLDRSRRDVLRVHPRGDPSNPLQGVFNTRPPEPDWAPPRGYHLDRRPPSSSSPPRSP
jgi:hypothetical protein